MQCSSTTVLFLLLSKPLSSVKLAKSQEIPWRKTKKRPLWNDIVDITVLLLLSTFAVQLVDYFPPLLRPLRPHYYSAQYDPHIKAKSREIEYNENGRNLCQALWRLLLPFLFTKCFGDYRKFQFLTLFMLISHTHCSQHHRRRPEFMSIRACFKKNSLTCNLNDWSKRRAKKLLLERTTRPS